MSAPGFNIDEAQLQSILNDVEKDLVPVLKSEASRLAKAQEDSAPPSDEGSEDSAPAEGSASPAEGSAPPSPSPEGSAPPVGGDAPPAEGSAPPGLEGSAPPGAGGSAPALPTDPAALQALVAQLPPEQQKALYLATKQAIFAQASAAPAGPGAGAPPGAGPSPEGSAPPMAPPGAGAPPAGPPSPEGSAPPMMGKGEMKPSPGNGGKSAPVHKSEVETLKDLVKTQGDSIELLTKAVKHMATTPIRKAVTGVSQMSKSEKANSDPSSLSKTEVKEILTEKIRGGKLEKKDRDNIRRFYDSGSNDITLVESLLTDSK